MNLVAIATLVVGLPTLGPQSAYADTLGTVTRYTLPTSTANPYGIVQGPDGNMWFVENNSKKVGKVTHSGTITEYNLSTTNAKPDDITSGPDGALWFTSTNPSSTAAYVNKMTTSGTHTYYSLPNGSKPLGIIAGPDGNLWVASFGSNKVYRVQADGNYTSFSVNSSGRPGWITADYANDAIWFSERLVDGSGNPTTGGYIGRITMDGTVTEYAAPSNITHFYSVTMGPDGNVWFAGQNTNGTDVVGKVTSGGTFTTYNLPTFNSDPWTVRVGLDGNIWGTLFNAGKIIRATTSGTINEYNVSSTAKPIGLAAGTDGNMWFTEWTGNRVSKVGTGVTGNTTDADSDSLTVAQELGQGTVDTDADTDNDGLSDYVESTSYTNRNAAFCNSAVTTCEYPDPLQKDLYVEVDWMQIPSGDSTKPTSSQIDNIEAAFTAEGIDSHFDTGQLDGGNEVEYAQNVYFSPTTSERDLYDYKNGNAGLSLSAQFDSADRYGIWRYQLIAAKVENDTGIGGVAYAGDDDSIIAYQSLKDRGTNMTARFPRTMLHELGHNLCLMRDTYTPYTGQHSSCLFEGIDVEFGASIYISAMNYDQQFTIDYSNGPTSSTDHDDWSAVRLGIDDFSSQEVGDEELHSLVTKHGKVKKPKDSGFAPGRQPIVHKLK